MSTHTAASRGTIAGSSTSALRRAVAALYVGAAAAVGLAAIFVFATTSPDNTDFRYVGDYLQTADGIPYAVALIALLPALRTLPRQHGGQLVRVGILLTRIGAVVLLVIFVYGLAAATSSSFGPTYVLASFATVVGVALFVAGSWRSGLLPRWMLAAWAMAWAVGGLLPILQPGPLLLAAVYLAMAMTLPTRVRRLSAD